MKIVSVDALPAELAYVEKGLAPVLLAQPTYLWGYVSVKHDLRQGPAEAGRAGDHADGAGPRDQGRTSATWARQLKDWGFTDVPRHT